MGPQYFEGAHFTAFMPLVVFSVPFAIGNYFVADRMGKSKILWVVLSLIPFVNFFFFWYVFYSVAIFILDRLNRIAEKLEPA